LSFGIFALIKVVVNGTFLHWLKEDKLWMKALLWRYMNISRF
jgi:hypothetical protein